MDTATVFALMATFGINFFLWRNFFETKIGDLYFWALTVAILISLYFGFGTTSTDYMFTLGWFNIIALISFKLVDMVFVTLNEMKKTKKVRKWISL